ncbi:MAG TPA: serine/threonine-protein kinase, partial [Vicinamibacterales bacterium]|nr:serine/threonine-protein kinase [Vicinamibacterales bacterium]
MCGDDESLRREVESLVAEEDGAASFLETPVPGVSAEASLAGRTLGAYRLDARIGAGGMGEVYRARDTRLGRDVAVKILPPSWTADAQRRVRFEREARAIAALNHPNICTIHDIGRDSGVDFLVMELVDGEPLAARLAKGPLPLDQALARAIEIAGALDAAHRQGIVHRDLKPGNVMLARTDSTQPHAAHAKLLDFGLARIAAPAVSAGQAAADSAPLTEAGALLGTLHYMAPEQIEGRPADARTDIFAFGALFYEMLTARRAFQGASTAAVIAAILREEPPPVQPADVNRIVRRCVAKDPLRRYQAARDLLNDLEEVRQGLEPERVPQSTARPPRRAGRRAWLAAAVLLAVLATGYVRWGRPPVPAAERIDRFQLQPPAGVEILPSGPASVLAISPDGQ